MFFKHREEQAKHFGNDRVRTLAAVRAFIQHFRFEDRHEGRLLTVFTASNYCGSTGNYGAVVVFQARPPSSCHWQVTVPVASPLTVTRAGSDGT